ncbi:alpha/beta fold hydrolase [uncultured Roseobacter sp.]|uniref:alpha/beta fold hydrolase n=1 Tax=uncultured Roseobacter sp. TaxID=114847 RepID=UPI00262F0484|nr:alpha/beta fold hydrolase [uncultured Roseobacter sp.]
MTLFFTRRTYNAAKQKFTNNPAALTRFVQITKGPDSKGRWSGGAINQSDWLRAVKQEASANEITVYVHGFNTDQIDMLRRLDKIKTGLRAQGYRGAVIGYDWPSDGKVFSYDQDRNRVKDTAQFLVRDGILPLLALSPRPKINLIAHSMGAYVILRGFSNFDDTAGPGASAWRANEIAFLSGDVARNWLGKGAWGALLLSHRARRFTNYYSEGDRVLPISAFTDGFRKRVGRDGLPTITETTHIDVNATPQYLRDVPPGKRGKARSHRWWFDSSALYADLAQTFAGKAPGSLATRQDVGEEDLALMS